jgi:hypothetical protein
VLVDLLYDSAVSVELANNIKINNTTSDWL